MSIEKLEPGSSQKCSAKDQEALGQAVSDTFLLNVKM